MKLNEKARVFKLNDKPVTRLVVAAHQDDIEIMCGDGIARCYDNEKEGLCAVVVTDGGGSPRNGEYADYTYEQMVERRVTEQYNAAVKGNYAVLIMLGYTSKEVQGGSEAAVMDIAEIIREYAPAVMYGHNPADKHLTHVSTLKRQLEAALSLPYEVRPKSFFGCECWRGLDWLPDDKKVIFDTTGYEDLLTALLCEHRSQVEGGKRYDLAADGRRRANCTFLGSHEVDDMQSCSYGVELTALLRDDSLTLKEFTSKLLEEFSASLLV